MLHKILKGSCFDIVSVPDREPRDCLRSKLRPLRLVTGQSFRSLQGSIGLRRRKSHLSPEYAMSVVDLGCRCLIASLMPLRGAHVLVLAEVGLSMQAHVGAFKLTDEH